MVETTITAPSTCSAESPCSITITATSDAGDFGAKPVGGYPSGAVLSGFFLGATVGNTISVNGVANAASANAEFINVTPGPGDSPISLPSASSGDPAGRFTATVPGGESFYDLIAETIQLDCGVEGACPPSMSMSVNITFVNPGDSVDLPGGFARADSPEALIRALSDQVRIDIHPGSFPNSIQRSSQGNIPVAILSSSLLDAPSQVIPLSLKFGRTGNEQSLRSCDSTGKDVNGDGRLDLVCHFDTQSAGFQVGDTRGILKGDMTVSGTTIPFMETDSVRIIP